MMSQPFFTIIIVSLNAEMFIERTIRSIVEQTFKDYEIIIKDGLSKDDTIKIAKKYSKPIIIEKKDNGLYDAMNQAINLSNGKYIIFMNCGDCFASNNVLERIFHEIGNQKIGMVFGDYTRDEIVHKQPSKITRFYLFRTPLCHQTVFFNGECLRNNTNHYDTTYKILADYDLELRLFSTYSFKHVEIEVCSYLGGGISETKTGKQKKKKERSSIIRKYYSFFERFIYGFILLLTFPRLRNKIAEKGNNRLHKFYQKIVNRIN